MTEQQAYQMFLQESSREMQKTFIEWDNDMLIWHTFATEAIDYASPKSTGYPQEKWIELYEESENGINCLVFSVLSNNLSSVSRKEIGWTLEDYEAALRLNAKMIKRWHEIVDPITKSINDRLKIMNGVDNNRLNKGMGFVKGGIT